MTASSDRVATLVLVDGAVVRHSPGAPALLGESDLVGRSLDALVPNAVDRASLTDGVRIGGPDADRSLRVRLQRGEDADWLVVSPASPVGPEETILAAMRAPAYATDPEGTVTYLNRAFEETLGYDREDVLGGDVHFSTFITSEAATKVRTALGDLYRSDASGSRQLDLTAVAVDGREVPVEASVALLPGDGGFPGSGGVLREASAERRREELLTVIDRALRHDLRTHVNAIAGYASAVEDRTDDGTTTEYLGHIGDSAAWLGKLGETLRTLQKAIEEESLARTVADSERIVDSVASRYRRRFPEAVIETHVTTDADVAAGRAIEYVLENLVENAVVHNDGEDARVGIWLADAPRDGWVDIHVEDDGPGMPAAERDVVLGDAEVTQLHHGSGVGLWVCRWIVDVFDGEIHVDEEESGTVVTVRLRRASEAIDG